MTTNDALDAILSGRNVEILGGAGRGKSTLINSLSNFFSGCMLKVGPTGSSALNVGGQTLHRTFGLALEPFIEGVTLKRNLKKERAAILKSPEIQMLVIDEVGACRVLTTINDEEDRYVNGSSGTVLSINRHSVTVELDNGNTLDFEPKTSYNYELFVDMSGKVREKIVGSYTQIPLRLGAAISIHRSQGMTLDQVDLQLSHYHLFGNSMLYVAVSRCRDLNNLKIHRRLTVKDIVVDQYVVDHVKKFM